VRVIRLAEIGFVRQHRSLAKGKVKTMRRAVRARAAAKWRWCRRESSAFGVVQAISADTAEELVREVCSDAGGTDCAVSARKG